MINCLNGRITLGRRTISDTHAYGVISVADALAKSSNVGAIKMALRVGEDRLIDYIRGFGFGRLTGIDLPGESGGMLNDRSRWHGTSIASIAIGQEIGVTALQAVSMMAAVANHGIWTRPHIVKQAIAPDGALLYEAKPERRQVVSEQTARTLAGMLEGVVTHGTARRTVQLAGYTAAGKTGTPQKVDPVTKRYSHTKYFPNFAGFVPASDPRFAIIVAIDEPIGLHQGGTVAAPIFDRIAEAALSSYAVPPDADNFRTALAKLEADYRSREPSAEVAPMISRALAIEPGVMPDLQGRNVRAVAHACATLSLKPRFDGSGFAVRQVPAPGARVKPGDLCQIEFQ
jgi:cell division protein FtsI (penicillin-binding protein 3)